MKRILFTLLLGLIGYVCNAQIYSKIMYYDKFDDVIKTENKKTLITQTDSSFIFEVKGREPVEYWIFTKIRDASFGDKDHIVDLTGKSIYGYQECWAVVNMKDKEEYLNLYNKYLSHEEESGDYLSKNALYIIHRTISRYSYEFQYDEDFFWIQDYSNANKLGTEVNRIIYFR